jgi:methyl-accepting chemotaxis protein/methyl-accepting chemotaxis protein-1 (serine sensor receptor)
MTVGKKLYTAFGAAILITIVMGLVAIHNLNDVGDSLVRISTVTSRNLYLAGDVNATSTDMVRMSSGMNLRAHMNDLQQMQEFHSKIKTDSEKILKDGDEFLDHSTVAELKDKMKAHILDKQMEFKQLSDQDYDLISKGQLPAADSLYRDKIVPLGSSITDASNDLADEEYKLVLARSSQAIGLIGPARTINLIMIALALAVGFGAVWVVRGILGVLQSSIVELGDGADQVASAAAQVSSSSQSLAQGASEQAASLEETSASSEEINSMARRNTDNSRSTAELLARSQEKVSQANSYLEEMVVSMDLITESSGKISKIIKVIDEIAFQTNILALNAAVEAARAGEAGMGFAVVADEVRSLAQRSAQAAKDTATLIEDSITRSNEGKVKVDQVALAIQAVTEDSTRVKVMVDEVSLGSEEQSRGIDQIGRSISQMEQVTQTNAASAEESAAAAEELSAQSETLKDVLSRLNEMVGGGGDSRGTRTSIRRPTTPQTFRPRPAPFKSFTPTRVSTKVQARSVSQPASSNHLSSSEKEFPMEESFQSF